MKITAVEPIKLQFWPPNPPRDGLAAIPTRDVFLVRVDTDEGISGIGEGFALGSLESLAVLTTETLTPLLLGEDPTMIEALWNKMYLNTARYGRRGIVMASISAVDIALWDILGKKAGLPVYKLLGAAKRELIPYASAGYYMEGKGIRELQEECLGYVKMGFSAIKIKVGGAPVEEDIARVHGVREAVGPDIAIGIDANNAWDYPTALRMARACERENILFFEEPMSTDYPEDCVRLASNTDVSIAGYETLLTRYGMKDFIVRQAVDIVQADAIWTGGITEAHRVGILAGTWGKLMIPHFSASMVSLSANLSVGQSLYNTKYMEYTLDENPLRSELCLESIVMENCVVRAFDKPGLGIELNPETVEKYRV